MIESGEISDLIINYILNLSEVVKAKEQVDSIKNGYINFSIDLKPELKQTLFENFHIKLDNINSIPMRWIKGDTQPHIDRSNCKFNKTYLAYLTDSPGKLIIDGESYPISKGKAYVFSEGLSHETIDTGFEPRLLLGPMSEQAIAVGAATTIQANGATEIIYIRYDVGSGTTYKINNGSYNGFSLPLTIENTNTAFRLQVLFETDIVLFTDIWYIICASDNIQFGSTSLNSDGTRPVITIDGVTNYPGLIRNGILGGDGFNNIYVFNLEVRATNGSTLPSDGGWIGQSYFGRGASNNFVVNCSSNGPIIDGGGGILGGRSGSINGILYIIGCSSSGPSGRYSGGIIGFYAGEGGGAVTCENCWSTGAIGQDSGGIFGYAAGNSGFVRADNCYSQGPIGDVGLPDAGGIYGSAAGYAGTAEAENCYSQGPIGLIAGGIYGSSAASNGGATFATNCYSSESPATSGNGIYSGGTDPGRTEISCYSANGSWSDLSANNFLTGTPNPVVGTTWVSTIINYPYELNNMGYTPYTIQNIVFQGLGGTPILNQTYNQTISVGESSLPAIRVGYSYDKMKISGGSPSSYQTILVNDYTGIISTTSSTTPGTYTITIRNTGSYNITLFTLSVIQNITPNVPICFPAGTPVLTDQGEIAIEKIDTKVNTIGGKEIVAITESIPLDSYLICIERNSLGPNVPNRRVIITKDHKVMCDNKLVRAEFLIRYIPSIYKVQYNKEKLYNVLLKEHSTMSINNLIVETMNPNHILAKIYLQNLRPEQKNILIQMLNKYHIQQRKKVVVRNNIFRP